VLLRVIPVTVVEGTTDHADGVVVGFLRPVVRVYYLGELGVPDLIEYPRSDFRPPDLSEELGVPPPRHEGQVFFCDPRVTGQKELIENLIAGSPLLRRRYIPDKSMAGKFLCKDEPGGGDALLDFLELLARALKVRFGGAALQGWPVPSAAAQATVSELASTRKRTWPAPSLGRQRDPSRESEELLALKRTIGELGSIGRNLNQIAHAANQGHRDQSRAQRP